MSVFSAHITDMLERNRISRELIALYIHRVLTHAGMAVVGVFTVIFVYQFFEYSLSAVLWTYGILYLGVALMTPVSARLLGTFGTRGTMLLAMPCLILAILTLYAISEIKGFSSFASTWGIGLFVLWGILFRALYWVPYQIDMSQLLDRSRRGVQLALLENTADVNIAAMPFWGGLIVAALGFGWLFMFSIFLIVLAIIPLLRISNRFEKFSWGYMETWVQFFASRNRPILLGYVGYGIQSGIQLVIWPLFVFLLLNGEFIALGAIAAITLFFILLIRLIAGRFFDDGRRGALLKWGAVLSSSGWLLKIFVTTPFTVVIADTYHGFGQVVNNISIEAMTYEQASDNGRFVDEFTVLKEVGLHLGRALAILIVGVAASYGGMYVGFGTGLLIASIAAFGTVKLSQKVFLRS